MKRTIVALDFSNEQELMQCLAKLPPNSFVKVGMEAVYACGFSILDKIKAASHDIFLDLKCHDIPNTVEHAMMALAKYPIAMVNVHAAGGSKMCKGAMQGLEKGSTNKSRPLCIAVTQLTSTSQDVLESELLIDKEMEDVVVSYALLAKNSGLDGVVCSVHEVEKIHQHCGKDFLCVTPGIRLSSDSVDDQKRVATPDLAKAKGSDYIVVGRSITNSDNPTETYQKIEQMMEDK